MPSYRLEDLQVVSFSFYEEQTRSCALTIIVELGTVSLVTSLRVLLAEDGLRALEAGLIAARRRLLELNQYEPLLRPRTPPQQGPNVPRTLSNLQLPNNPAPWNQPQQSAPVSVQHAPQVSNEVRSNQAGPVQDIAGRQDPGQIGRHQAQQVPLSPDLTVAEIDRLLRQIQERRQ